MNKKTHKIKGFTLIEAIVSILISSIITIGVVNYIADSAEGMEAAARRNRLAASGQVAIQRLTFELHNALPNSVRVAASGGAECLEFIPVRALTSYLDPSFRGSGSTSFEVVDFTPDQVDAPGGYAAIFPDDTDRLYDGDDSATYADWPDFPNNGPIKSIASITEEPPDDPMAVPDARTTINLVEDHRFRRRSPNQRFFLVEQPVSYCVREGKLYRYTDYTFFQDQVTQEESGACVVTTPARCLPNYAAVPARQKVLMVDSIEDTGDPVFTVEPQTLRRNSLVRLDFTMSAEGESIRVIHEIHSRMVP